MKERSTQNPKSHFLPRLLIVFAVFLVLLIGIAAYYLRYPERTQIHNLSGQLVTDVVLEMRGAYNDQWATTNHIQSLRPGKRFSLRHNHTDSRVVIQFTLGDRHIRFEEPYINLWTGEGWCFDILPDATVRIHRLRPFESN